MRMVQSMSLQPIRSETTTQLWNPQVYLSEIDGDLVLHIDESSLRLNLAFSGHSIDFIAHIKLPIQVVGLPVIKMSSNQKLSIKWSQDCCKILLGH